MVISRAICSHEHEGMCTASTLIRPSGASEAGTNDKVWVCHQGSKPNQAQIICDQKEIKEVVIGENK